MLPVAFLLVLVSISSHAHADNSASIVSPYIVLLRPGVKDSGSLSRIERRTGDASRFSAHIDARSRLSGSTGMGGFRVLCDKESADEIARDDDVQLVERDSEIRVDEY